LGTRTDSTYRPNIVLVPPLGELATEFERD
jgi:hypothetical protein